MKINVKLSDSDLVNLVAAVYNTERTVRGQFADICLEHVVSQAVKLASIIEKNRSCDCYRCEEKIKKIEEEKESKKVKKINKAEKAAKLKADRVKLEADKAEADAKARLWAARNGLLGEAEYWLSLPPGAKGNLD